MGDISERTGNTLQPAKKNTKIENEDLSRHDLAYNLPGESLHRFLLLEYFFDRRVINFKKAYCFAILNYDAAHAVLVTILN